MADELGLKVRVIAYQGKIVLMPIDPEKGVNEDWWPTSDTRGGCVIGDSKKQLGVSEEALELMEQVKRNHDDVGDLGWWKCTDGKYAFSWWGAIYRVINVDGSEASRDFRVHRSQCTIISNDVPQEVKLAFEDEKKISKHRWRDPILLECSDPPHSDD